MAASPQPAGTPRCARPGASDTHSGNGTSRSLPPFGSREPRRPFTRLTCRRTCTFRRRKSISSGPRRRSRPGARRARIRSRRPPATGRAARPGSPATCAGVQGSTLRLGCRGTLHRLRLARVAGDQLVVDGRIEDRRQRDRDLARAGRRPSAGRSGTAAPCSAAAPARRASRRRASAGCGSRAGGGSARRGWSPPGSPRTQPAAYFRSVTRPASGSR